MADVTEVLHRINYEVNSDALNNATTIIQSQLAELNKLGKALEYYSRQLNNISTSQVTQLEQLGQKIDQVTARINSSASKTRGLLDETFKGVIKGLTGNDGMKDAVASYVQGVTKEFDKLQIAGKTTVTGFASHMKGAGVASAGAASAIANIGKSLMSFTGIAGIALSALSLFSDELFKTKEKSTATTDAIDKVAASSKRLGEESGAEISKLILLKARIEDTSLAYNDRINAIREMQRQYPGYFQNLTDEEILAGKVANAYNKILVAIVANAKARVLQKDLDESISKVIELENKILDLSKKNNITLNITTDEKTGLNTYALPQTTVDNSILKRIKTEQNRPGTGFMADKENNAQYGNIYSLLMQQRNEQSVVSGILSLVADNNAILESAKPKGGNTTRSTSAPRPAKRQKENVPGLLSTSQMQEFPVSIDGSIQPVDTARMQREEEEKDKEKKAELEEQRKENIKSAIDDYKALSEAAQKAYNEIIQAQIDALDKEISIREKRVEEAKKLAERGNVEALRLEEDRLRKAQEQRARFARQQQIVNSAITVRIVRRYRYTPYAGWRNG